MTMNVLIVGPGVEEKGGISSVIKNMLAYSESQEIQYYFLSTWHEKGWILSFFKNLVLLNHLIKKKEISIVHFHVAQNGSFYRKSILLFFTTRKVKTVFHMHASKFSEFYKQASRGKKRWIRFSLNRADVVVAVSDSWKTFYEKLTTTRVVAIHNAVKRQKINYNSSSREIITLGRIGHRKGSYDILEVAKLVYKKNPTLHFHLFGDGEVRKFTYLTEYLPNVTIHSWLRQGQKEGVLANAALHYLPSYSEGLPMAVLETMSQGIPNLATEVGGIPAVIQEGNNGFLCIPGEVELMAEKICAFFLLSDEQRERISLQAFSTIEQEYSLESYMKQWKSVYQMLISSQ